MRAAEARNCSTDMAWAAVANRAALRPAARARLFIGLIDGR